MKHIFIKQFTLICLLSVNYYLYGQTKIIAHRGFWNTDGSAQNSITALKKAAEAGVYGSEFDVIITADGIPVVNHDDAINGIRIEDADYKSLKNIKLKNGETLPTLEKYLKAGKKLKKTKLILEIKPHKQQINEERAAQTTVNLVKKLKLTEQVEYISFSLFICKELHRLSPGSQVAYLNGNLSPSELKEIGLTGLDYNQSVLQKHPEWVQEAHTLGLSVNVWTVNDINLIRKFTDDGVDFITTDKPLEALSIASPALLKP
ncbi:MAG: glycerophosphodiester phosphodiesterase [Dysgonamonadaceae bacterium]|jgi:glycerophosphoryl diester phosphodiesterase|nr:glycerophosphodiester phosphodiesterase [Dysgonamonadaceae bacterium]